MKTNIAREIVWFFVIGNLTMDLFAIVELKISSEVFFLIYKLIEKF